MCINAQSVNWQNQLASKSTGKNVKRQICQLTNMSNGKIVNWQNGSLEKWSTIKLSTGKNVNWQNDHLATWSQICYIENCYMEKFCLANCRWELGTWQIT